MTSTYPTALARRPLVLFSILMGFTFNVTISDAQDLQQDRPLVLTTDEAEAVQHRGGSQMPVLQIDRNDLESTGVELDVEPLPLESVYDDETRPVVALDRADNTDFTIGMIAQDTADGKTYRDPYSVENIEMDPLYPEGRYVDTLRASAGVDLSSKF